MSFNKNAPPTTAEAVANSSIAIWILALAGFTVVTTEFLIVGLLPALARDLSISLSSAGQLVTLFAFTVMICGPFLTAMLSGFDRKRLFVVILLIFAVSNVIAALSPNIWVLAIARIIPAAMLPVFWGTASETAGQVAAPGKSGQAVSTVYLGISAAMLFGIPLGTYVADTLGWRGAFWLLAGLSLLSALLTGMAMPHVKPPPRKGLREQAGILKERAFIANVLLSVVAFTASFAAYTYLAGFLEDVAKVAPSSVAGWLMGFGAIGLFGNWLGGKTVDANPLRATAIFLGLLAVATGLVVPLVDVRWAFVLALAVWGVAYTAIFPICQVRVMKSVTHSHALAGTTNVSAANAGIGLGAVIGGAAIPAWGIGAIGYVSAVIAVIALLLVPIVAAVSKLRESD